MGVVSVSFYFSSSDQSEGVGSHSLPLPSGSIAFCFSPICLKYFLSFLSGNPATASNSATSLTGGGSLSWNGSAYTWTKPNSLSATKLLVVAGGGGGGRDGAGGGGAGGLIYNASYSLSDNSYSITVGAGGSKSTSVPGQGSNGQNSTFGNQTAIGGGGGGSKASNGRTGGSAGRYCHRKNSPSPGA